MSPGAAAQQAAEVLRAALAAAGVPVEEDKPGRFTVTLPGERRLATACSLVVGEHSVSVNAFVARRPEDDPAAVHRFLLERNARAYGVSYAIDHLGDVYLVGHIPLHAVTGPEVDRVLGSVLEHADGAFNTILELGFADAIRSEWAWRTARGEPTTNLEAFRHLTAPGEEIPDPPPEDPPVRPGR